ncbi:hypothetical protein HPP92_025206 [Vanilla planifolia]|nr:hypothetical protein HPP92_025206 [Vanilla planifolia]
MAAALPHSLQFPLYAQSWKQRAPLHHWVSNTSPEIALTEDDLDAKGLRTWLCTKPNDILNLGIMKRPILLAFPGMQLEMKPGLDMTSAARLAIPSISSGRKTSKERLPVV